MKLITSFTNVTSFKLKIMTLILNSTIPLNLFMEIILSHMTHLLSFLLFIHLFHTKSPLLIESHYFDPMFFFFNYRGLHKFHLILLNLLFRESLNISLLFFSFHKF